MHPKPKILISRCFFEPVRYDGGITSDPFVEKLKKYIEPITFCPEVALGLGIPRSRILITKIKDTERLIQPETGRDLTEDMIKVCKSALTEFKEIDGFLLKAKSPSCGVKSTKLYQNERVIGKTSGFFARLTERNFPYLPLEDEGRLKDLKIRDHFLTRIFAFAELRELLQDPSPSKLVRFHTRYKYLLMSYDQSALKKLGQVVASSNHSFQEKLLLYKEYFYKAFQRKTNVRRHINTLQHIFGYLSKGLSFKEREHFFELLEKFQKGLVELTTLLELLKSWAVRFEKDYFLFQSYLEPYPKELLLAI
jgi:uncharacterized protein YbgA (DUF1722 family)/uncharacterized protein YbbK (DUF523 family)